MIPFVLLIGRGLVGNPRPSLSSAKVQQWAEFGEGLFARFLNQMRYCYCYYDSNCGRNRDVSIWISEYKCK